VRQKAYGNKWPSHNIRMPWILLFVPFGILMIPIVAILANHQQKMARILNQGALEASSVDALRQEIGELKSLVHQQAIALDDIARSQRSLSGVPHLPAGDLLRSST
jgi:hypothetical protein